MNILEVVGTTGGLTADDTFIHDRLVGQGHTVTQVGSTSAFTFAGVDLVVVSTSPVQSNVSTKLDATTVPVISLTGACRPHSTYSQTGTGGGPFSDLTWAVLAAGDPLAAGLTGTQTLFSSAPTSAWQYFPTAQLGSGAVTVWSFNSAWTTSSVVSRVGAGGAMYSGTAPSRRAVMVLHTLGGLSKLAANGLAVFDAMVTWASTPPPTANAGPDVTVTATGTPTSTTYDVALTGSGTAGAGGGLTYAWTVESGTGTIVSGATTTTPTLRVSKYGATVTVGLVVTESGTTPSAKDTAVITVNPVAYMDIASSGSLVRRQLFTAHSSALV